MNSQISYFIFIVICIVGFLPTNEAIPTLGSVISLPYGATAANLTITGTDFDGISGSSYQFLIGQIPCTNIVNINLQLTCTISFPSSNLSPFIPLDITLFQGSSPITISQNGVRFTFNQPLYLGVQQVLDKVVYVGNYFYSLGYMKVTFGGVTLVCSDASTASLSCTLTTGGAASLNLGDIMNNTFNTQSFTVKPYLTSLSNNLLPTNATKITINGNFFSTPVVVKQGSTQYPIITGTITNNLIEYTTPIGIFSPKTISVQCGSINSTNSLVYSYQTPTLSIIYQQSVENNMFFTIAGTNFGNNLNLIQLSLNNSNPVTASDISNTQIIFNVSTAAKPGALTVTVDGQTTNSINLNFKPTILSVSQPSIQGGNITVTGQWLIGTQFFKDTTDDNVEITSCSPVSALSNYPVTVICTSMPPGIGIFDIYASSIFSGTKKSEFVSAQYQPPTITDINPKLYNLSGNGVSNSVTLSITGKNFQNSYLSVTVDDRACTFSSVNYTNIVCSFTAQDGNPEDFTDPIPVKVQVGDFSDTDDTILHVFQPKICPSTPVCSGHGACESSSGKCICLEEYTGNDCSLLKNETTSTTTTSTSDDISDEIPSFANQITILNLFIFILGLLSTLI